MPPTPQYVLAAPPRPELAQGRPFRQHEVCHCVLLPASISPRVMRTCQRVGRAQAIRIAVGDVCRARCAIEDQFCHRFACRGSIEDAPDTVASSNVGTCHAGDLADGRQTVADDAHNPALIRRLVLFWKTETEKFLVDSRMESRLKQRPLRRL